MDTIMFRLPPIVSVAFEVLSGKYGISDERRKALEHEGYDYNKVQSCVNDLISLFAKYG